MKTIKLEVTINDELSNVDEVILLIKHLLIEPGESLKVIDSEAIAEHEEEQWYYKKPRSNDKNLWGKDVLVERKNRVGDNYFSIDIMPLSGNIIRWRELPKHYQPTEKGGK